MSTALLRRAAVVADTSGPNDETSKSQLVAFEPAVRTQKEEP